MSIQSDILLGLSAAKTIKQSTLTYLSGSTTVSCSVFKSYSVGTRYDTDEHGYTRTYSDLSVIAQTSDISGWGLEPKKSKVTVDGVDYMTGPISTDNEAISWISLRAYNG